MTELPRQPVMREEQVALYDAEGKPCGVAPRSLMRSQNLRHAATGIVVRNSAGEIYVHQRTAIKDVYPSRFDFAAGGVMAAGEQPDESARRELGEELGISGVELQFIGEGDFADEHTDYHAFLYQVTWDGPIVHQPEEVAWGGWWTPQELQRRIAANPDQFMPDSLALWNDAFTHPR